MSPRPRKVSDEQLFAAAHAVMNRVGPGELTLAAIAEEAGVTAAVLVQRFGSKRGLMLALSQRYAAEAGGMVTAFAQQHRSPLAALRAYVECVAGMAASPTAMARSLAYLQIDLTDAEFRTHLVEQARATRKGIERLLRAAVEARELDARTDARRLAGTIEAVISGSMLTWAVYQEGNCRRWMRREVDHVLEAYERRTGSRKGAALFCR